MNPQPHVSLMSHTQPLKLKCDILEGVMNLEMEYEIACTPWRSYTTLSRDSSKMVFPSSHLDPYGFKMIVDIRSSLRDLQGDAFQLFMRGKGKKFFMNNGRSHWRNTKM